MSDLKTKANDADVGQFLAKVPDAQKRADSDTLMRLMKKVTGEDARMWGGSIIGFGSYHYKYKSGRSGNWMTTGFSPRKAALTVYIMQGFSEHDDLMQKLGRYKTGRSCLYIKRLSDVDLSILEQLIERSYRYIRDNYPPGKD
ncbi:MAG: DUF1801 domain-containing protein [Alphaproteobacteria bacterium]|nr:DUF1801 domain-containing protein [Alphaproteobacteria bacterium]